MKVTLFGGSFNPPHLGHALVIAEFLESAITDELWLLPTINHAFGKDLAPAQHRLAMAKLLINFINHDLGSKIYDLKLCPIEIDLNLSGQTYDTLHALKQNPDYLKEKMNLTDYQLPITSYQFLIGSDQLASFQKWGHWQELLSEMPFWVYPRANYHNEPLLPGMTLFQTPGQTITNISSSQIRDRLKNHQNATCLLPEDIMSYINHNNLYSK